MKALLGLLPLRHGCVLLDGQDISTMTPQGRVKAGIAFVPQTDNVFRTLSVEENLEMGAYLREDGIAETMAEVFELFPILREKRQQPAGELSGCSPLRKVR